ncbi:hypothetical protein DIPPA_70200 [Diplonema papillatum]|nr:hypothetical protein DIPPA_70200 [Diplonema papillatum]
MGGSAHLGMTMAALYAGGAAMGYKAGCQASTAAGLLSAAGMGTSVALINKGEHLGGHAVGAAVSGITGFFMGRRYFSLRHPFMPNGFFAMVSGLGLVYNVYKGNEWRDSW